MPKAYSYIRFSSLQQAQGDSFRRQSELTLKACEKYNLDLDTELTFADLGVSGFKGDHVSKGALGKFIQLVDEGVIQPGSWLIVESLDRLGREGIQTATARYLELLNKGITIYTCLDDTKHEPTSGAEAMTKLMYSVMVMSRANEESATKSKRGKASWNNKRTLASNGRVVTKMIPSWLTVINDNIEVVEDKAKTVRLIFDCNINGMGTSAIASHFNKEQVPHISNKKNSSTWHSSYIDKILNNSAVYGSMQLYQGRGKHRVAVGELIENYYPKVIDKATFQKAKNARNSRKLTSNQGRKGDKFSNLFQGLVKCTCGANMRYSDKGRNLIYFQCSDKVTGKSNCNTPSFRYDKVEPSLLVHIADTEEKNLLKTLSPNMQKQQREVEALKLTLQKDIEDLNNKIENLVKTLEIRFSEATTRRLNELEKELQNKTTQADSLVLEDDNQIALEEIQKHILSFIAEVSNGKGTLEQRTQFNNLLKNLVDKIVFTENKEQVKVIFKNGLVKDAPIVEKHKRGLQAASGELSEEDEREVYNLAILHKISKYGVDVSHFAKEAKNLTITIERVEE